MNAPRSNPKAYWNTAPIEFLTATGAVVAKWGFFEQIFEGFAKVLSRPPHLSAQAQNIPISFRRKSELILSLEEQVFYNCPSLMDKIRSFHVSANNASRKRNILTHGLWFDFAHIDEFKHFGVTIQEREDGSRGFYQISIQDIEKLSLDINDLTVLGTNLHSNPYEGHSGGLTPDEIDALRQYHTDYPAPPREVTKYRGPKGKGNLQIPKLFRDLP